MGKRSERYLRIKEYYKDWYKDDPGREPPNIASVEKLFKTSENYVYGILQDIADVLGRKRDELLPSPHCKPERTKVREHKIMTPVDLERLKHYFEAFSKKKADFQQEVNDILEKIEQSESCIDDEAGLEGEE